MLGQAGDIWVFISIHALREEGDLQTGQLRVLGLDISIHALREEGDDLTEGVVHDLPYFYPRPPRGGRQTFFCSGFSSQ